MDVSEAVANRHSTRAFLPDPVDRAVIERVLDRARFAPSGGNVQPWQAVVVTRGALRRLLDGVAKKMSAGEGMDHAYSSYPDPLPEPWMSRRRACAADMYKTLGIAREDRPARAAQVARNWVGFGAPCLLFTHMPAWMERAQWADLGIWLQTVMLLLQEEGLATCAQGAWAHGAPAVRDELQIPDDHVICCGLAIGHADPQAAVNSLRTSRAPIEQSVRFLGFDE